MKIGSISLQKVLAWLGLLLILSMVWPPSFTQAQSEAITVYDVAFHPDGTMLVSAHADGTVRLWDVESGENTNILNGHEGEVYCVGFSSDGQILASGGEDKTVQLWNTQTGENQSVLTGHETAVYDLAFTQVSPAPFDLLFSVGGGTRFWDYKAAQDAGNSTGGFYSVAVSADGKLLVGGEEDSITLLNFDTMMFSIPIYHTGIVWSLAFQPDTTVVASGGADGMIKFTEITPASQRPKNDSHEELGVLEDDMGEVYSVAFSPDGEILASGSEDGIVRLWDVAAQEILMTLEGHQDAVRGVAISPDGSLVASASADGTIQLWDASTGENLMVLQAETTE